MYHMSGKGPPMSIKPEYLHCAVVRFHPCTTHKPPRYSVTLPAYKGLEQSRYYVSASDHDNNSMANYAAELMKNKLARYTQKSRIECSKLMLAFNGDDMIVGIGFRYVKK